MNGRLILLSCFLTMSLTSLGALPVAGQEELYQKGNALYQAGDFTGALESYQAVLQAGFESADLYYNLGNSFFKTGALGPAILNFERARRLSPGSQDIRANLKLARSLTADQIEPLPRFWVLSALSWWVDLFPGRLLRLLVVAFYLLGAGGLCLRILSQGSRARSVGGWIAIGALAGILLFGTTLLAHGRVIGGADWGIIMTEEVPVQSAPSLEDDLTLFLVHEGTKVRLDQRTEEWTEIVLEDGKVGWIPSGVLEII